MLDKMSAGNLKSIPEGLESSKLSTQCPANSIPKPTIGTIPRSTKAVAKPVCHAVLVGWGGNESIKMSTKKDKIKIIPTTFIVREVFTVAKRLTIFVLISHSITVIVLHKVT